MGNETPVMKIPIPYPSSSAIDELFDYDRFLVDAFTTVDKMKIVGSTQIRNAAQYTNLQTALDELGTLGGGILYAPKGTYTIGNSVSLSVPANVWIIGADAVFKSQSDTTTSTTPYFTLAGDNVRFVGIRFLGSESEQGFVRPAVETNGRSVEFYRCQFIGVRSVIHTHSSNAGTAVFKECLFRNLWGDWIEANSPLVIHHSIFRKTNKLVSTNSTYRTRGTALRLVVNKPIRVDIQNTEFEGILRNIIWFSGCTSTNFLELNILNTKATNYGVGHFGNQSEVDAEWAVVVSEHDGLGRFVSTDDATLYADINIINSVAGGTSALFLPNNISHSTLRQGVLRVIGSRFVRTGVKPSALSDLVFIETGNGFFSGSHLDDGAQGLSGYTALRLNAASANEDRTPHLFVGCFLGRSSINIPTSAHFRWSVIDCTFTFGSGGLPNTFNVVMNPSFVGTSITDTIGGRFMYGGMGNLPSTDTMGYFFRPHPGSSDVSVPQVSFKVQHGADPFTILGGGFVSLYHFEKQHLPISAFRRGSNVSEQVVSWNSVPIPVLRFPYATTYDDTHAVMATLPMDDFLLKSSTAERPRIYVDVYFRVSSDMGSNQNPTMRVELFRIPKDSNSPVQIAQQDFGLGGSSATSGNLLRLRTMVVAPANQTNAGDGLWVLVVRRIAGTNDSSFTVDFFGADVIVPVRSRQVV